MAISMQQQTVVSQVAELEQSQEAEVEQEVQLTELLPVNQSRITEDIFEDTSTTDALKALRSLSGNNGESFDLKEFEFNESVEQSKHGDDADANSQTRKRTYDSRRNAEDKEENPKKIRRSKHISAKSPKHKLTKSKKNDETTESDYKTDKQHKSTNVKERTVGRETFEKERSSKAEAQKTTNREILQDVCENDHIATNDNSNVKSVSRKKVNKDRKQNWNSKEIAENDNSELRRKIDDIIQSNNLLNNNIEFEEDAPENISASSVAPIKTKTDNGSRCNKSKIKRKNVRTVKAEKKNVETKKTSMQKKQYYCEECDRYITGMSGLCDHRKVVHSNRYKCDNCGEEFRLKERLKKHVLSHMYKLRSTPYTCKTCSMTFETPCLLVLHTKTHQTIRIEKLECDMCGSRFSRRDSLQKHKSFYHHGDFKSLVCEICNRSYKGHLSQHMRTHARERPFGCGDCGQRFAQKSQLTVHQRTHSGQRPFRCVVCWQAFAHSTALKLHTRRHTGERPFKCADCNAGFTQLPHWKKHMKCVHGKQNPYGCKYCGSSFKMRCEYDRHRSICELRMKAEEDNSDVSEKSAGSFQHEIIERYSNLRYKMSIEKMRLLLAALLKRISKQERLDELGFGKRLIDDVLQDSLTSAGKEPVTKDGLSELEALSRNVEIFLEWTVPKEHWRKFREMNKSTVDILEALTSNN